MPHSASDVTGRAPCLLGAFDHDFFSYFFPELKKNTFGYKIPEFGKGFKVVFTFCTLNYSKKVQKELQFVFVPTQVQFSDIIFHFENQNYIFQIFTIFRVQMRPYIQCRKLSSLNYSTFKFDVMFSLSSLGFSNYLYSFPSIISLYIQCREFKFIELFNFFNWFDVLYQA